MQRLLVLTLLGSLACRIDTTTDADLHLDRADIERVDPPVGAASDDPSHEEDAAEREPPPTHGRAPPPPPPPSPTPAPPPGAQPAPPPPPSPPAPSVTFNVLPNIRLPGNDIGVIDVPDGNWQACQHACSVNSACRAWTYRNRYQGVNSVCLLKNAAGMPIPDLCCRSGIRQ